MKKQLFLAAVVLFTTQAFSGTTITVRTDGSGNYLTIAEAITASTDGDIIDVLGTFTESGLIVTKGITIQGHGFAKTIVQGNSITPDSSNYATLTRNSVFYINNSGGNSNINVILKNMTIKNGVSATDAPKAGGLTISRITGLVTLSGLKIVDNFGFSSLTANAAGGLFCVGSNLNIDHCWITGNTASENSSHGGGMQLQTDTGTGYNGVVNIRNTSISGNHGTGTNSYGGGIAIITGSGTAAGKNIEVLVENSTIYGNDSKQMGNGIYLKNVILTAAGTGFGTTNCAAKLTVNHCTVANNIASRTSTQSYGITFDNGGTGLTVFSMNNSIVMGNYSTADALNTAATTTANQISAATTFDNITGCITNSITKGGAFTGLTGYNVQNGGTSPYNYTGLAFDSGLSSDSIPVLKIGAGSSAIGFVTNNILTALTTDQLGNSRVANTDAGAYESTYLNYQTITFGALTVKKVGDANFDLTASASSGLAVSYSSSNTGVATVSGSTVTIVGAGTTTIYADQEGNSNYYAAPQVSRVLTVGPATGIVSVQNNNVYLKTNPVTETLLLEGKNISQICIYNALGKKMIQSAYLNGVDVSKLQSGIYFAIVKSEDTKTNAIRFIKQ